MLSVEDAVERVVSTVVPLGDEIVPLDQALYRTAAEDVVSPIALPPFDNSAMDGYAVQSADVAGADDESPVQLTCVGEVPAGAAFAGSVRRGECVRIFTGSPLPPGADAVVMQEDTRRPPGSATVAFCDSAKPWENIRLSGEDIKAGACLVEGGRRVQVGHIALAAACGLTSVRVGRRPVVGVVATGSELVEPGQSLPPGGIYESNRMTLSLLSRMAGGIPRSYPIVPDDLQRTREAIEVAVEECDILLTSGAVSVGDHDHVKPAIQQLGGALDFWRVAVRPGKPFMLASVRGTLVLGLPGNPVSAYVTFMLLARPALLKAQGAKQLHLPRAKATLGEVMMNRGGRRHFVRVRMDSEGRVFSSGLQASHALSGLAAADGLLDLPPGTQWEPGKVVEVWLTGPQLEGT